MGDIKTKIAFKRVNEPTDVCPGCRNRSPRVYGEPKDSQGHNDLYVCDDCLYLWPTEWSDAYQFKVKH